MKRVKAACILQTLEFSQKAEMGYPADYALKINRQEVEHYEAALQRARTRYQIVSREEHEDGSILLHVRKQYNDRTDVAEYFE